MLQDVASMGSSSSSSSHELLLQQRIYQPNYFERLCICIISPLLFCFLIYRVSHLHEHHGTALAVWLIAFFCELWFTFIWVIASVTHWNYVEVKAFPHHLTERFSSSSEFPPIDVFVTTADPVMEPPIITMNTVLSFLAADYPPEKLACYVSDDGCAAITYYSLVEACTYAEVWVPFCKKYGVEVRAPFMYFSESNKRDHVENSSTFQEEWKKMKASYEMLVKSIQDATEASLPHLLGVEEFSVFSRSDKRDHPSIIKVINEHKPEERRALPHLIYISREKRPDQPHHFKAGAMNVLTRVSGVMTNAPFMLNVDCDFFVNNPKVFRHALCFLYGFKDEKKSGFVHFPQVYYNGLKDDPFGCQMKILIKHLTHGMEAFQGPTYVGTGCFHRRKIIYGQSPPENIGLNENGISLELNALKRTFGEDELLLNSVVRTLSMEKEMDTSIDKTFLTDRLEAAKRVASCDYELNTQWGNEVGLVYGGAAEDVLTGFRIHSQGWHSVIYFPEPPAFLGCTPTSAPVTLVQHKRWATGLLEVLLRSRNPLHAIMKKRLLLGQYACYLSVLLWAVRSVPELCYAMLPTICIITNVSIFPEVNDPMFRLLAGLFIIHNFYTMMEYHLCGLSLREWWNNQRMLRIISCTSWLLGLVSAMMKSFGLSETIFELTKKDDTHDLEQDEDLGKFTFTSADIFVPATTLLFINMGGLIMGVTKLVTGGEFKKVGELVCCVWLVLSFLPFLKGLFRRQPYGLPWSVILKSGILAFWLFYITSQFIR